MTRSAIAFLFIVLLPSLANAGAWCMPKGALYNKISQNTYYTSHSFDDDGNRQKNSEGSYFYDYNLTWYGEYGLLDDLSLFGTLPWKRLKSYYRFLDADGKRKKINATYNGLGDLETGFKYGLVREPLVLSVQGLTKLAWFYDGGEDVPPGNNQTDYELKLLAGKSLWPFPGYCGLELGYRWRFGAPSDEYRYLLEFGFNPSKKIYMRFKLDGIKSARNAKIRSAPASGPSEGYVTNPSLGLEYDLGKLECTLGYQVSRPWSVELTYTANPYGKAISAGNQLSAALVYYYSR